MDKRAFELAAAAMFAAFLIIALTAQEGFRERGPHEARPSNAYTVGGVRHGISFFPRAAYAFIKPKAAGEMDFTHYHTYDEVTAFLRKWASDHPDIVELYSVGKSFEGRDIWQITITNKSTGKDTDKPAMFIEGNRHSDEVTAAESALWFAWHILSGYGRDTALTRLVDTKAIYVRIKNNPDGSELYLNTA
jgi:murein tripeptide amidase MpaA